MEAIHAVVGVATMVGATPVVTHAPLLTTLTQAPEVHLEEADSPVVVVEVAAAVVIPVAGIKLLEFR